LCYLSRSRIRKGREGGGRRRRRTHLLRFLMMFTFLFFWSCMREAPSFNWTLLTGYKDENGRYRRREERK
jgi:hypothetical protein